MNSPQWITNRLARLGIKTGNLSDDERLILLLFHNRDSNNKLTDTQIKYCLKNVYTQFTETQLIIMCNKFSTYMDRQIEQHEDFSELLLFWYLFLKYLTSSVDLSTSTPDTYRYISLICDKKIVITRSFSSIFSLVCNKENVTTRSKWNALTSSMSRINLRIKTYESEFDRLTHVFRRVHTRIEKKLQERNNELMLQMETTKDNASTTASWLLHVYVVIFIVTIGINLYTLF